MHYRGIIIEESLADASILKDITIVSTEVEQVTPEHHSGVPQWTMHTVDIPEATADAVAEKIAAALVPDASWYADFKNETTHYIVYRNKVFKVNRTNKEQYDAAKAYGLSLGIPEHQVDFHPEVKQWER